jgi:ferredoxin
LKYHIEITRTGCIACGTCYAIDSAHYESSDDGKSRVVGGTSNGKAVGDVNDEKVEDAKTAALACPVSVITVTET